MVTKYYRFGFKKVFASLCEPKKRQKSSGTFVALLILLVLAWKLRKVAAQPRLVHKAKLTSRKLAISFLVTECVVLHMSVYGKKEWKKKETEWLLWCFHLISFFSFTRDITKIKYKETLKCLEIIMMFSSYLLISFLYKRYHKKINTEKLENV